MLLGSKVTPCQPTADAWTLWAKWVKFSFTCAEIRSGWLKKVDGASCGWSLQRRKRNYGSYWSQWHWWELKMTASFQTQLHALYIKTEKSNPIFSATILFLSFLWSPASSECWGLVLDNLTQIKLKSRHIGPKGRAVSACVWSVARSVRDECAVCRLGCLGGLARPCFFLIAGVILFLFW